MRHVIATTCAVVLAVGAAATASAHCQIPCGIYDDELRVQLMEEHVRTVEKAMRQIGKLHGAADGDGSALDSNQLVRWVVNKEEHAQKIQDIVTAYFLAQRIKAPDEMQGEAWDGYVERLRLLHAIQVEAMKAKQTVDTAHTEQLKKLIDSFRKAYFGEGGMHDH